MPSKEEIINKILEAAEKDKLTLLLKDYSEKTFENTWARFYKWYENYIHNKTRQG